MQSFKLKFLGVTILQGVEFFIFLLIFEWALQQCCATCDVCTRSSKRRLTRQPRVCDMYDRQVVIIVHKRLLIAWHGTCSLSNYIIQDGPKMHPLDKSNSAVCIFWYHRKQLQGCRHGSEIEGAISLSSSPLLPSPSLPHFPPLRYLLSLLSLPFSSPSRGPPHEPGNRGPGAWGALWAFPVGSGAKPQPTNDLVHIWAKKSSSGGNIFGNFPNTLHYQKCRRKMHRTCIILPVTAMCNIWVVLITRCSAIAERPRCGVRYRFRQK